MALEKVNGVYAPQVVNVDGTTWVLAKGTDGRPHYIPFDSSGAELFTSSNPGSTQLVGRGALSTTHHTSATIAADGTAADLAGTYSTLTLQIKGSSATGQDTTFKGSVDGTNYTEIVGVRVSDSTEASSTIGDDEIWQFDVTGLDKFLADLTTITSGSITITSKAVP